MLSLDSLTRMRNQLLLSIWTTASWVAITGVLHVKRHLSAVTSVTLQISYGRGAGVILLDEALQINELMPFCLYRWNTRPTLTIQSCVNFVLLSERISSVSPITVAALSKAWTVFLRSNTGGRGFESVCIYSVLVLFCVYVAALRRADLPSKKPYRLCIGLRNWKSGQGPAKSLRVITPE
jgi:hypothetical protein